MSGPVTDIAIEKTQAVGADSPIQTYGLTTLSADNIHTETRKNYLFGHPIAHSLSPLFHNTIYDSLNLPWSQTLIESRDPDDFFPLMRQDDFIGASVTMPHKVSFLQHVDAVTEEARIIGAMNTLFVRLDPTTRQRRYIGTNTDCLGVQGAFEQNVPGIRQRQHGRPALVIGGGGACRAATYAVSALLGASVVYLVNRYKSEVDVVLAGFAEVGFAGRLLHVETVEQARALEAPVCIVGGVPDFPPQSPEEVQAREVILEFLGKPEKGVVLEACYHPRIWTEFAALSEANGWQVIIGTEMMISQGLAQDVWWTEKSLDELPVQLVQKVIREAVEKSQH